MEAGWEKLRKMKEVGGALTHATEVGKKMCEKDNNALYLKWMETEGGEVFRVRDTEIKENGIVLAQGFCYGHEGMNYVTHLWASDKSNTRTKTGTIYVTRPWASDKSDIQTYKETQPHLSRSSVAKKLCHSPMGE